MRAQFDEDPKYAAYVALFEPLCGPGPQRPILLEDKARVGQKRGRDSAEDETLEIVRLPPAHALWRCASVCRRGRRGTLLAHASMMAHAMEPAGFISAPPADAARIAPCSSGRERQLGHGLVQALNKKELWQRLWKAVTSEHSPFAQTPENSWPAPWRAATSGAFLNRAGAQEEDPAGPAGDAVDHGVQRAPAHEAAVPLQRGQHARGAARGQGQRRRPVHLLRRLLPGPVGAHHGRRHRLHRAGAALPSPMASPMTWR